MAAGSVNDHDLYLFSGGGSGEGGEDSKPQPGYFHVVASFILIIHGFTFLVPPDSEAEDTDMMRTVGKWLGFDWDWMKHFTPYAQVSTSTNQTSLSREGGVNPLSMYANKLRPLFAFTTFCRDWRPCSIFLLE